MSYLEVVHILQQAPIHNLFSIKYLHRDLVTMRDSVMCVLPGGLVVE